jgi:hypothetical protein
MSNLITTLSGGFIPAARQDSVGKTADGTTDEEIEEAIAQWGVDAVGDALYVKPIVYPKLGCIFAPSDTAEIPQEAVVISAGPLAVICERSKLDGFDVEKLIHGNPDDLKRACAYLLRPRDRVHFATFSGIVCNRWWVGLKGDILAMTARDVLGLVRRAS